MGWSVFGVLCVVALVAIVLINSLRRTETPKYKVVEREGPIEIREYGALIMAQTQLEGERKEAIRQGFQRLAGYIFGRNSLAEKVRMTAPVLQEGKEISWTVRFVMPAKYTLDTLPEPNNDQVQLSQTHPCSIAVVRFSGMPDSDQLEKYTALLTAFLQRRHLHALSSPVYAFYNPPWTLPALRRNEIWIKIEAIS